jgi:MoaA/NifB/PqqE/SkfB family radical SAM enzyme
MNLPSFVQIEPVGYCNLRCGRCPLQYRAANGNVTRLDFDVFRRIIDQFPALNRLSLQGLGEPLLHPRLFEMVAYAARRGIRVTTTSNLHLLNGPRAAECVASGLARLNVSIDAAEPESYARIRPGGDLDRVLGNLSGLMTARRKAGTERPETRLAMALMWENLDQLPAMIRLAAKYGIGEVVVEYLRHDFREDSLPDRYLPLRGIVERQRLTPADAPRMCAFYVEARKEAERLGIVVRLPRAISPDPVHEPPSGQQRCGCPWSGMYFSHDGWAMPCGAVATPDRLHFANVLDSPAELIWNGTGYRAFRRRLDSSEPPTICRSCAIYQQAF